jgi:hypothetical protein
MVEVQFLNFWVTPAMWENYVWHTEKLMKETWEAETLSPFYLHQRDL